MCRLNGVLVFFLSELKNLASRKKESRNSNHIPKISKARFRFLNIILICGTDELKHVYIVYSVFQTKRYWMHHSFSKPKADFITEANDRTRN